MTPLLEEELVELEAMSEAEFALVAMRKDGLQTRLITTIRDLRARVEAYQALIRECRLADGHAARTGDETRWDRAFHALCRAEALPPVPEMK